MSLGACRGASLCPPAGCWLAGGPYMLLLLPPLSSQAATTPAAAVPAAGAAAVVVAAASVLALASRASLPWSSMSAAAERAKPVCALTAVSLRMLCRCGGEVLGATTSLRPASAPASDVWGLVGSARPAAAAAAPAPPPPSAPKNTLLPTRPGILGMPAPPRSEASVHVRPKPKPACLSWPAARQE